MTFTTSRSNVISFQSCPRKRFLSYHHNGQGIQKDQLNSNLFIGSCVHKGLELLLQQEIDLQQWGHTRSNSLVDVAVEVALKEFDEGIQQSQFDDFGDPNFLYFEYRNLVEALIRVYAKIQLPRLLQEFEVLGVEKELEFWLVEPLSICSQHKIQDLSCSACTAQNGILFLSRPDGILRRKRDGNIFILSFKTSATYDSRVNELQNKYDMQGISETVAVERWLESLHKLGDEIGHSIHNTPYKVSGVKMEFLLKGTKIGKGWNKGWINNALIHPWRQEATGELSYFYEWVDDFQKNRKLGKGWSRINIWELGDEALKEWIELLMEHPLKPLEGLIVIPEPYNRNSEDVQSWITQTIAQEQEIRKKLENKPDEVDRDWLDRNFGQTRGSCFSYAARCQFHEVCWYGLSPNCGDFKVREINHPRELELIQIEGGSK